MSDTFSYAVVIDNGTDSCRAGIAGAHDPSAIFPTVVARPPGHYLTNRGNTDFETCRVGHEAIAKKGELSPKHPVEHGLVTNWDDMEMLWHHAFQNELKIDPKDQPVLLTEPALNPKANREKMTQIMFETFQTPAMYAAIHSVLALYCTGRTTGFVVDCGEGIGMSVPIYEGYALPHAILKLPCTGYDLTFHMLRVLHESELPFTFSSDLKTIRDIKEKMCSVALDLDLQLMTTPASYEKKYVLPDGKSITVGKERFITPEAMFQPHFLGFEIAQGVHYTVNSSIRKCDDDIRANLFSNITLAGGSTKFPGFAERLEKELTALAPEGVNVKVTSPQESDMSVWRGGSILAALPSFQEMWISREEYEEIGPAIVHKKCF